MINSNVKLDTKLTNHGKNDGTQAKKMRLKGK